MDGASGRRRKTRSEGSGESADADGKFFFHVERLLRKQEETAMIYSPDIRPYPRIDPWQKRFAILPVDINGYTLWYGTVVQQLRRVTGTVESDWVDVKP